MIASRAKLSQAAEARLFAAADELLATRRAKIAARKRVPARPAGQVLLQWGAPLAAAAAAVLAAIAFFRRARAGAFRG